MFPPSGSGEDELKECVAKGACKAMQPEIVPSEIYLVKTEMPPMATARIGIESMTSTGQPYFKTVIDAGEPVGTWKPIEGIPFRRRHRIRILENSGSTNDLDSTEIEELDTCTLGQVLPADITNEELRDARIAMMLNDKHQVVLKITVRGQEYLFQATRWHELPGESASP